MCFGVRDSQDISEIIGPLLLPGPLTHAFYNLERTEAAPTDRWCGETARGWCVRVLNLGPLGRLQKRDGAHLS